MELAVTRIQELKADSEAKQKKIDELEMKIKDEGEENDPASGDEEKDDAENKAGEKSEKIDAKALQDANEKLKAENEKLKADAVSNVDAVKKLSDKVEGLSTRTDAIGKKQVRKLWNDSDGEIDELKAKRLNVYADSRGGK